MGFAHAGMGMQQVGDAAVMRGGNQRIKEVWKSNLDEEMAKIRVLIEKYPYVSMVWCLLSQMWSFSGTNSCIGYRISRNSR